MPSGLSGDRWRFGGFDDFIDQYTTTCALLSDRRTSVASPTSSVRTRRAPASYAEVVFSPATTHRASATTGSADRGRPRRTRGRTPRLRCDGPRRPDLVRDAGVEMAERSLEVALGYAGRGVVALNAAGSERAGIEPFGPLFRRAKDAGLRSVPHAGEWAGPRNVWETLEHYLPDRIGHGVRASEDIRARRAPRGDRDPARGVAAVQRRDRRLRSVAEHPFRMLRDAGASS